MKKRTQKQDVLAHLRTHKKGLTSMEAFSRYGITRLAGVVFELKKEGHEIDTNMLTAKDRRGKTVSFAQYTMRRKSA